MSLKIGDTFKQFDRTYKVYGFDSQGRPLSSCEEVEIEEVEGEEDAAIDHAIGSEVPSADGNETEEETHAATEQVGEVIPRRRRRQ